MTAPRLTLDTEAFLADHWQREPLFIPGAVKPFTPPISADELAGLALEDDIESRIVAGAGSRWELAHGPFRSEDFNRAGPWTLLVQSVDHYLPEVADLRRLVDFLPQWRIDDVMVSYATDGGSVGPHYDNYDVFLLQGEGQRLWRLGQRCDETSPLLAHPDLRVLETFEQQAQYLLSPGDMLYVPPGVAHWGIAVGECTTFSIGFRAPRINDMVSRKIDQLLDQLSAEQLLGDAGRETGRPGEITAADVARARAQVMRAVADTAGDEWFGEVVTETDYAPAEDPGPLADVLEADTTLRLAPESRLAWQETDAGVTVYVAGQSLHTSPTVLNLLVLLCDHWSLTPSELVELQSDPDCATLLDALYRTGCVYVSE